MFPCTTSIHRTALCRLAACIALLPLLCASILAQQTSGKTPADAMTIEQIADIAARGIAASSIITEKYTYTETEHIQNYIDGQLMVDHTKVFENIFIHNLPYMKLVSVDGQPLTGKELKRETAAYDEAVKQKTALDRAARANLDRHALRTTSRTDLDRLPKDFQLSILGHEQVDGHDCLIFDAVPRPLSITPDLARHIRMDIDTTSLDVLDIRIEFLAEDGGFSKGSVLDTHYTVLGGVPLATHQTWETTVRFKELLNKAIGIKRDTVYSNYRRFRATVVIKAVVEDDNANAAPDAPDPLPANATPQQKAQFKAAAKAKAQADKKAREDAKKNPPPPPTP